MAEDKSHNGKENVEGKPSQADSDGGLGNLPPLSDFDSGGFKPEAGKEKESFGGLPPIGDISEEIPNPTGGNIKAPPPGFGKSEYEFESPVFDTPEIRMGSKGKGKGFQGAEADSDFSPETPEIGPGPDSDMDTPLFESAFGGVSGGGAPSAGGFTPTLDTPAPTQAMETPMMFGGSGRPRAAEPSPFDDSAFSPVSAFEPSGTPMPDFSPDTAAGPMAASPPPVPPEPEKKKAKAAAGGSRAKGILIAAAIALVCLIGGLIAGPRIPAVPNPMTSVVADRDTKIAQLQQTVERLTKQKTEEGKPAISQEKIDELLAQQEKLTASVTDLTSKEQEAKGTLDKTSTDLKQVKGDLDAKNEEYVKSQEALEDLQNQTAIVQARQLGLVAEVERLTGLVGVQEEAATRSLATKESLQNSVERLVVQVKEGIPLTPEKFAYSARCAAVESLLAQVKGAKWVTPALLDAYTILYQKELEIGASTAYFFARIPITNRIGLKETNWSECLMKGNWAVYYRTLDGKNIGSYENIAEPGATPKYEFRETLPDKIQKQIEGEVIASRPPGSEIKLKALAEKQTILNGEATSFQKAFNSM